MNGQVVYVGSRRNQPVRRTIQGWLIAIGLLVVLRCGAAAQDAASLARPDWEEYLATVAQGAETHLRAATRGAGDPRVNEMGYLQAQYYYQHLVRLAPDDPGALASRQMVEQQLARFRRQHRWQLFTAGVANALGGTPATRDLNDGQVLGIGRSNVAVEAGSPVLEELVPERYWTLSHSRRRLPFLFQLQGGLGMAEQAAAGSPTTELIAGHASAELDYTVLPLLGYLLPYAGLGYGGMFGYCDEAGDSGHYFFHGTFLRLGAVVSLGRTLKVALDYGRSLELYDSEFDASDPLIGRGIDSCTGCFASWRATRIGLEFLF